MQNKLTIPILGRTWLMTFGLIGRRIFQGETSSLLTQYIQIQSDMEEDMDMLLEKYK